MNNSLFVTMLAFMSIPFPLHINYASVIKDGLAKALKWWSGVKENESAFLLSHWPIKWV